MGCGHMGWISWLRPMGSGERSDVVESKSPSLFRFGCWSERMQGNEDLVRYFTRNHQSIDCLSSSTSVKINPHLSSLFQGIVNFIVKNVNNITYTNS